MCAHLFDNFALDDLLVALKVKREGGKWGDVVGGIDPVIHILEAIHRCEHSHASSFTLLQKGETGFDRPVHCRRRQEGTSSQSGEIRSPPA